MKLVILGATGPTGQHLVTQALEAGHEVTAVVRNPDKMKTTHDKLNVSNFPEISTSIPDTRQWGNEALPHIGPPSAHDASLHWSTSGGVLIWEK